jgi:hypothetical protein
MGQTRGLKRLNIADRKKAEETAFNEWANATPERKALYGNVISLYEEGFDILHKNKMSQVYIVEEAVIGIEALLYAYRFGSLSAEMSDEDMAAAVAGLKSKVDGHYKDYIKDLDQEVCAAMLRFYHNDIPKDQQPADFLKMVGKYKGDFDKMAAAIYKKSIFVDKDKTLAFLNKVNVKKMKKDPMYKLMATFINHYRQVVVPSIMASNESLEKAKRLYVKGLMEMNADKAYSSDANSTMRLTYGSIKDYYPADAVHYNYFTTMDGVLEKYVPGDIEFDLPDRFVELAKSRTYGDYADKDGELHVCFLSNNDITGGNSGSPVINAEGHLIGTAFDGNWEAMSGDIAFEPELQRTISVDIRYTLWVIDVYAGAGHLVKEMTLIK